MNPLDYFGSDAGLKFLANLVILTVLVGLLVSVFVVRSAWRGLRATKNRTNGRKVYARHLWRQALAGILILILYLAVALDLLLVDDASIRSALARLGLFFALLLTVFRNLDLTYTQRAMGFARAKQLEAEATGMAKSVVDTQETAHRIEEKLEENNVISSGKQDVAAGKQDVAANQQQTDIDLSEKTQKGVDRLERQGKEGK